MNIVILLLSLIIPTSYATVFRPQTIQNQIKASHGVFLGHYLRSTTIELEDGKLATQMVFRMTHEQGLQSELFGMDEIIVHYPGGSLGDRHVRVEGVPEFIPGEKVVLFVQGHDNRYWGMNLGFGSFRVIKYGNETMLVNYLFPNDPKVGQVPMREFESLVKSLKGTRLKVIQSSEYLSDGPKTRSPASVATGQNRSVASKPDQSENSEGGPNLSNLWLLGILAFLGGIFRLTRQNSLK